MPADDHEVSLARALLIDGAVLPGVQAVRGIDGGAAALEPLASGRKLVRRAPVGDLELCVGHEGPWHRVQVGGWSGRVERIEAGIVTGWAVNDRHPDRPTNILALTADGNVVAVARAGADGRFTLILPAAVSRAPRALQLTVAVDGGDRVLDGGRVMVGGPWGVSAPARLTRRSGPDPVIAIKVSTPNLKEAPLWGDYHFANSLAAAFARIGVLARVDTEDSWYAASNVEDVVLTIRGRHRVRLDTGRINLMWLISHPDRIPNSELADYDHVAVASDVYARTLREAGLADAQVLHQATDAGLFGAAGAEQDRLAACLFVGNSRREYRTMVKWCVQRGIPLELYGGGWDGILPPDAVCAPSVANADLPRCYAAHLLLLNDHWDSMRKNGFLSNRLFDGSATGTPILTDPVAGLEGVFGDTIATAGDADTFALRIRDCLADPAPWLERAARARDIVLGAHTFDHRAAHLARLIGVSGAKDPHAAEAVRRATSPMADTAADVRHTQERI